MDIKNWRKVIFTGMFLGVIVAVPNMTQTQVDLVMTLIIAAFSGNGIEHVTGMLKERKNGKVSGGPVDGAVRAVRSVTATEQAPRGGRNSH